MIIFEQILLGLVRTLVLAQNFEFLNFTLSLCFELKINFKLSSNETELDKLKFINTLSFLNHIFDIFIL